MNLGPERVVRVGRIEIANTRPFVLIAGPCQIESRSHALEVAQALREMSERTSVAIIYKSSYDKANRTSASAARWDRHGGRPVDPQRTCGRQPVCRC